MSRIIRNNQVVEDDWNVVKLLAIEEEVRKQAGKVVIFKLTGEASAKPEQIEGTEIPATGKIIVPFPIWLARKDELAARLAAGELGVWLESFELIEDLAASIPDLNAFPVIAANFPRFADGRCFSIASLLRTRYGFKNEIRAIGDVQRDQLYYMRRCGFDAFAVRADRSIEEALESLRDFSEPYQGAVDDPLPVWRRHMRHVHVHANTNKIVNSAMDDVD